MRKIVLSIMTAASLAAGVLTASSVAAAPLLSGQALSGGGADLSLIQQARWRPGRQVRAHTHAVRRHAVRHHATRRNLVGEQVFSLAAEIIRGQLRPHARRYAYPPAYYVDEPPAYAPAQVYGPPQVYAEPYPVYAQPEPVYVPQPVYFQPQPVYVQARPAYVAPRPAYVPQQVYLPRAAPAVAFGGRPHHDGWAHAH